MEKKIENKKLFALADNKLITTIIENLTGERWYLSDTI